MIGITTKNITNANGVLILKGEIVQCLCITPLGNNKYEGLFVTETGVKFVSDFSNVIFDIKR
jgi:hypothetical protein